MFQYLPNIFIYHETTLNFLALYHYELSFVIKFVNPFSIFNFQKIKSLIFLIFH